MAVQEFSRFQNRLRAVIIEKLALFVVRSGISINRASQAAMKEFVVDMINLGVSLNGKRMQIEEVIGNFSRTTLTEKILQLGGRMKERDISAAKEVHFVNIIIDAGTVLGKK